MSADPLRDPDHRRRPDGCRARGVRARRAPGSPSRPGGSTPGTASCAELDAFRPDLILSDYTLPRFDGMAALALARERAPAHALPDRHRLGQRGDRRRLHEGRAPPTTSSRATWPGSAPPSRRALARVQARTEKARAEEALRRSEANLRAIFNTSLQAFVLVDRDGTIQALNPTAEAWASALRGRAAARGRPHPRLHPRGRRRRFEAALGGEARSVERCLRGADGVERWYETTHAPVVDEHGTRHRRLPQRPRRERAQAGRAGAPGERGPLPRPVRQRERPGLHHRRWTARFLYVNPRLARGHRLHATPSLAGAPLPRPGPPRQPGALRRGRGARPGRRDADGHVDLVLVTAGRRCRSRSRATSAAPPATAARPGSGASTAT